MNTNCSVALPLKCQLGEGLHCQPRSELLYGVDIEQGILWRWLIDSAVFQTWQFSQRISWILSTDNCSKLLLGLQGGVALGDVDNPTQFDWLNQGFLGESSMRLNDAKADITGAVWAGSLNNDDESRPDGCLYRLGLDGSLKVVDVGYKVANGPAINANNTLMLHTDSGRRTIYAFDLEPFEGRLKNKRIWKVFSPEDGYPDGMCFDVDGCVWVAHWGGGCVSRFALDGTLLNRINIPATNVTNICFGGKDLDRLFVTTARVGLTAEQLKVQPNAGNLFEISAPGVKGLPSLPAQICIMK